MVLRLLETGLVKQDLAELPAGLFRIAPPELPKQAGLEPDFVAGLKILVFEKLVVTQGCSEQQVPRRRKQHEGFRIQPVETVLLGAFAGREPPTRI